MRRYKPTDETIAKEICRTLRDCPPDSSPLAVLGSVHGAAKVIAALAIALERGWLEVDGACHRLTREGREMASRSRAGVRKFQRIVWLGDDAARAGRKGATTSHR